MIGAEQVKLIAFDVDGTLTDGTLVMGSGGEAYKLSTHMTDWRFLSPTAWAMQSVSSRGGLRRS